LFILYLGDPSSPIYTMPLVGPFWPIPELKMTTADPAAQLVLPPSLAGTWVGPINDFIAE
jgi:hypothetical protein